MYWYENLKRKLNERCGRERAQQNILKAGAMPIGTISEIKIHKEELSIEFPQSKTPDVMSRAWHDIEKGEESMTKNFEKINQEIRKVVAKLNFFETKLKNMESSLTNIEKTHYVGKL